MRRLVVGMLLWAVACVSGPEARWQRASDHAQPLEQAHTACQTFAKEPTGDESPHSLPAKMAGAAFAGCMRGHGWEPAAR